MNLSIGITYNGTAETFPYYRQWVLQSDPHVLVNVLSSGKSSADDIRACDGLILSGGVDIHPSRHGKSEGYLGQPDAFNLERDAFEAMVFGISQACRIPLIGICRGMQMINCLLGGTLHLDNGAANAVHRGSDWTCVHGLEIQPGSLLSSIAGPEESCVVSRHHQSIETLAPGLVAAASWGGMVESIEWAQPGDKSFLLGVQWHPEVMFHTARQHMAMSQGVSRRFLTEVRRAKALKMGLLQSN